MRSTRFDKEVCVNRHAWARMAQQGIREAGLGDSWDEGKARSKDEERFWIAKRFLKWEVHLICVPAALEEYLVIKPLPGYDPGTGMHHFQWEG